MTVWIVWTQDIEGHDVLDSVWFTEKQAEEYVKGLDGYAEVTKEEVKGERKEEG